VIKPYRLLQGMGVLSYSLYVDVRSFRTSMHAFLIKLTGRLDPFILEELKFT
jgi:hypothetical protein